MLDGENTKKKIIYKHTKILKSYELVKSKKYKFCRKDLYIYYINALEGNDTGLNMIIEKLFEKPEWFKNNYDIWSVVNYLDRTLFGENVIQEIIEIKSIENIGIDKCVGYSRGIILTTEYIKKYKGKEYIIMENDFDTWQGTQTDTNTKDIWIIHKPTFIKVLKRHSCILKQKNLEKRNIYFIIKYIMKNVVHGDLLEFVKELFGEKV